MLEYHQQQIITQEICITYEAMRQPHVLMKPRIYQDGNAWCALYGENLMEGVCAFGDTPQQAAQNWDLVWLNGEKGNV